jgi:hypothetical protein
MVHCNDFPPDLEDVVLNMKLHNLCNPRNMEESLGHCTKLEYTQIPKNHIQKARSKLEKKKKKINNEMTVILSQ